MQEAVAQAVKVGIGLVSVGLGVALRAAGETPATAGRRGPSTPVMDAADVLVGTAWGAARLSGRVAVTGSRVARPLVTLAAHLPPVPRAGSSPGTACRLWSSAGSRTALDTVLALNSWTSTALPGEWTWP